jgi:single-stranded-DNA-specific exonuclease
MKKWQLQSKTEVKDIDQLRKVLLKNRQIKTSEAVDFFKPQDPQEWQLQDLGFNYSQFSKIQKRLIVAKEKKEKVVIFGDYDSDGICASAVLWEGLQFLGIDSTPFIPNRQKHGYGLSIEALQDLFSDKGKPDLLITVDNGIVALPALNFLAKEGVEVIITDHHQKDQSQLPILAMFHSTKICGAAVAWFLITELFKLLDKPSLIKKKINDLLSLVAIATVTDLIELIGINRSLVSHGLLALQATERPGLLALYQLAGVNKEEINSYHLGYVIGPRINAMGRLADSMDALRLLCTKNTKQAKKLANLLQNTNIERQDLTQDLIEQAESSLTKKDKESKIMIVDGDYHEGVIGLLAGRLCEKYLKPCIVLSVPKNVSDQNLTIKASARSLTGLNITEFLRQVEDQLLSVGGHPLAAGFSVSLKNLVSVKKRLLTLAKQQLTDLSLEASINVDCPISVELVNLETAQALELFEPYGNANPRPIFLLRNLQLRNLQTLGKDARHAKLFFTAEKNAKQILVLAWRFAEKFIEPQLGQKYDILLRLAVNRWRTSTKLQLTLVDIKNNSL